ncbi:MAG: hypothetical protein HQM12_18565 [SAR324 cluster bacterium]|nr:hypothetical protein [SAR324 cluster bacterium]
MLRWIFAMMILFCPVLSPAQSIIDFTKTAKSQTIVPSPGEVISLGKQFKIFPDMNFAKELLQYNYKNNFDEHNGVHLGRSLAVLLLALDKLDQKTLNQFFMKQREAFLTMKLPKVYLDRFDALRVEVSSQRISRNQLIRMMDLAFTDLVSREDSELKQNQLYRIIQGSAWVQAQNIMAKAIQRQQKYEVAKQILYQPQITEFIINQLNQAKTAGSPASSLDSMLASMEKYRKIMSLPQIGADEVQTIIDETDQFLTPHSKKNKEN